MKSILKNHLYVAENVLQNPLPEWITLFLAKIGAHRDPGFCAIFGPTATCMPKGDLHAELFDAKVAIFDKHGMLTSLHSIHHGHKYALGGGWVELDKHDSRSGVSWLKSGTSENGKCSHFMGNVIPPEDIFVAL